MFSRQKQPSPRTNHDEWNDSFYSVNVPANNATMQQQNRNNVSPPLSEVISLNDISPEDLEEISQTFGLEKLTPLTEMGFKPQYAWLALRQTKGNVEEALTLCLELDTDTMDRLVQQFEAERAQKKVLETKQQKKPGIFSKLFRPERRPSSNAPAPSPTPSASRQGSETPRQLVNSIIPSQNPNYVDDSFLHSDECFEVDLATALSRQEATQESSRADSLAEHHRRPLPPVPGSSSAVSPSLIVQPVFNPIPPPPPVALRPNPPNPIAPIAPLLVPPPPPPPRQVPRPRPLSPPIEKAAVETKEDLDSHVSVAAVVTSSTFPALLPSDSEDLNDLVNDLSKEVGEEDPMYLYESILKVPGDQRREEKKPPSSSSMPAPEPITILSRGNSMAVDEVLKEVLEEQEKHEQLKASELELHLEPFDIQKVSSSEDIANAGADPHFIHLEATENSGEKEAAGAGRIEGEEAGDEEDNRSQSSSEESKPLVRGEESPVLISLRRGGEDEEEEQIVDEDNDEEEWRRCSSVRIISDHLTGPPFTAEISSAPPLIAESSGIGIGNGNNSDFSFDSSFDHRAVPVSAVLVSEEERPSSSLPSNPYPVPSSSSTSYSSSAATAAITASRVEASPALGSSSSVAPARNLFAPPATIATLPLVPFKRRRYLPYQVVQQGNNRWIGVISLKQTQLKRGELSPQGSRPDEISLGPCATRELCLDLCESMAPPTWMSKDEFKDCTICNVRFSMFNKGHHCRNCGYLVCMNCSDKIWPSNMLPSTYHFEEKVVRVCHSCHYLNELFVTALREGDEAMCHTIYASGNINVYNPFTVYSNYAYAVHCAVSGGNMKLVRWLIEEKKCSLSDRSSNKPLATANGLTPLAVAALKGHLEIMNYLVHEKKASVTEINDVSILQRALHVALQASGPLPPLKFPGPGGGSGSSKGNGVVFNNEDVLEIGGSSEGTGGRRGSAAGNQLLNFRSQGINLQSTALLSLNGVTGTQIANPLKNRLLSTHATIGVNQFLEQQRTAVFSSQIPSHPPQPPALSVPVASAATTASSLSSSVPGSVASSSAPVSRLVPPNSSYPASNSVVDQSQVPQYAVPHIQQRPVSIAMAEAVRADLLGATEGDEAVPAEAFLAEDVVFTVTPHLH